MRIHLLGLLAAAMLAPATAALAVSDPVGDFLPTHAGPALPSVDIRTASVFRFSDSFIFYAEMAGALGEAGASYVWGVDRGAGTPGLFAGSPPVGPGVNFDAVVVLRPDGTGAVTAFNEVGPPTVTSLLGSVVVAETELLAFVDFTLLPSRGYALGEYRFNLWTRTAGGNAGIADLAQGEGTFGAVPEPDSWAMLIGGFALVGAAARRRRVASLSVAA